MAFFRQTFVISLMNLRAITGRWGASTVIVLGMMAVVGMMVAVLSMSTGALRDMDTFRSPERVFVRAANTQWENESSLSRESAVKIADMPGLKKGSDGKALASAEFLTFIPSNYRVTGVGRGLAIRAGIGNLLELRPEYKLIEGRMFTPGLRELIVGKKAHDALEGIDVGADVLLPDGPWKIVGMFDSNGRGDWALYGDSATLMPTFRRTAYNSLIGVLESPDAFDTFKAAIAADPTLDVIVEREMDYWGRWVKQQMDFYNVIAYGIGGIMAIGALFAALNIMYAAVSARTIEIATLRAIGFSPAPVVISIFTESLLLSVVGAAAGVVVAWTICNGHYNATAGFNMIVSPSLAWTGFIVAVLVGSIAALFPAVRAARLPVTTALQVK